MFERLESRVLFAALPPTNVLASVTPLSDVKVTWQDKAQNVHGFYVERSSSLSYPFRAVGKVGGTIRSFVDPTPIVGKTYYYRVRSFDSFYVLTSTNVSKVTVRASTFCSSPVAMPKMYSGLPMRHDLLDALK